MAKKNRILSDMGIGLKGFLVGLISNVLIFLSFFLLSLLGLLSPLFILLAILLIIPLSFYIWGTIARRLYRWK